MVDIECVAAEIRRRQEKIEDRRRKKPQDENIMACPILFHRTAIRRNHRAKI